MYFLSHVYCQFTNKRVYNSPRSGLSSKHSLLDLAISPTLKIDRTGSVDHVTGSDRPRTARTAGNVAVVEEMALKIIFIAVSAIFSVKYLIPQNY